MTYFKQRNTKRVGIRILAMLFVFLTSSVVNNVPASAYGEYENFYIKNNILLYDKAAPDCNTGGKSSSKVAGITTTTTIKTEKTANTDTIWDFLTKTNFSTNNGKPMSDSQAAGVMGNMYAESSMRPEAIEDTTRIDKGHGLVQWTFGRWDGADGLLTFATSKGADWTNVTTQMQFLQKELESSEKAIFLDSEFNGAAEPGIAASRWRVVFERANVALAHDDRRIGAAVSFFNLYGGKSSTKSNSCTSSAGDGVVQGNLVKTALYFALDTPATDDPPMAEKSFAKKTYQDEKAKYNPEGDFSDCGAFIATVMIASQVDVNFAKLGTGVQEAYVRAHPEKYQINERPTVADLKPGDILYASGVDEEGNPWGHVTMFTGEAKYPSVDASWHQRVPSVRNSGSADWMIREGAISVRVIK